MIRFVFTIGQLLVLVFWLVSAIGTNYGVWFYENDLDMNQKIVISVFSNLLYVFLICYPVPFILCLIEEVKDELTPKKEKPQKVINKEESQEDKFLRNSL